MLPERCKLEKKKEGNKITKEAVSKVNLFVILSPSTGPVLSLPKRSGQAKVEISNSLIIRDSSPALRSFGGIRMTKTYFYDF